MITGIEKKDPGRPEHKSIRLRLLETDVPDFPVNLPAWVSARVQDGSLIVEFENPPDSMNALVFPADMILRVLLIGSKGSHLTATIEHRDPYQVVEAFRMVLGSHEIYWIKAFGKMVSDKLGVPIVEPEEELF